MGKRASDEDKQRAQALYALGRTYREIAKELGGTFSAQSINNWARAGNWQRGLLPDKHVTPDTPQIYESANASVEEREENSRKLQDAAHRRWIDHKAQLADEFGERIHQLLDRAFAPTVVKDVKLRGVGGGAQEPIITRLELDMPSPADQVKLLTGVAILVDKASLLSGDATSRVETSSLNGDQVKDRLTHFRDEVAERRRQAEAEAAKRMAAG